MNLVTNFPHTASRTCSFTALAIMLSSASGTTGAAEVRIASDGRSNRIHIFGDTASKSKPAAETCAYPLNDGRAELERAIRTLFPLAGLEWIDVADPDEGVGTELLTVSCSEMPDSAKESAIERFHKSVDESRGLAAALEGRSIFFE